MSGEQAQGYEALHPLVVARLRRTPWLTRATGLAVILVALAVRLATAQELHPQIDEPASLLAIEMVASKGVPMLPSGILYLQGAVISYLAAPFAWLTDAEDLLSWTRFGNLLVSLAVPLLAMAITQRLTQSPIIASLVGLLTALDPNLIVWGIMIRPYGLLTVESLALVYVFLILLQEGAQARVGPLRATWWVVLLAFIGTFTHIGIWLLFPPLALVALLTWQRGLLGPQRPILIAGLVSLVAPALFLVLSNRVGISSSTTPGQDSGGFIGSHLFDVQAMLDRPLDLGIWLGNFYASAFSSLLPFVIAALSGVVVGTRLGRQTVPGRPSAAALYAIVASYWIPILLVCIAVTSDPMPRYVTHLLPLGYVIIGVASWDIWRALSSVSVFAKIALRAIALVVILVPSFTSAIQAADWRMEFHGGDPDYLAATRYVAEHRQPDEAVITALPPAAYFSFSEDVIESDLYFLAGPAGSNRSERYIKELADGSRGDYWLGAKAIGSTPALCEVLRQQAGKSWIIVDQGRIHAPWAFKGEMGDLILASSRAVFKGPNGVEARAVLATDEWDQQAAALCRAR